VSKEPFLSEESNASTGRRPAVSIIIVSYNSREWLQDCLDAIPAAAGALETEIVIVDNASVDGSAEFIEGAYPGVRLLRNRSNAGFAKAVNQGAAVANGRYVLLLNPDGHLKPNAIEALVAFAESDPRHAIVGGRTLNQHGQYDPRSCWAAPSLWSLFCNATLLSTIFPGSRLFDPETMGWFRRDRPMTVDIVSGCLMLVATQDWRALGGLDEKYFVYGEDADICLRARARLGRTCAITPDAQMVHAVSASSQSKPAKLILLLNGRIALVMTHFPRWKAALGRWLIIAGVWLRAVLGKLGFVSGKSWQEVWRERHRWSRGYQPIVPGDGSVAPG
jgi:N-acetylglucosaminyl-diphospho-decaprenol L-rhamnosyltransferase